MNMHRMNDGGLVALLLLASVLDVGGLYISQNSTTKVAKDDTFMVLCRDDEGLPITWKNSKGAILGPKTRPYVSTNSYGTIIMFLAPLRVEDTGKYNCSTKKDYRMFELTVEQPLEFTDTPSVQTGTEGEDKVLQCEVKGGSVSWTVDGVAITEENSKFKVMGDGLLVRNASRHDSKNYTCKGVQQSTGSVKDRVIYLRVNHKPGHPNHPHKHMRQEIVYSYINATVNLTCLAVANPPASFEWKANDKKEKIGHIINESAEVSILQLHIVSKTAFGNYKCIAKNNLGTYEENFTLKQGMRPAAPSNVQVKETRSKSVVLEIAQPERTPEMELETRGFSVQYRKIDDKDWKQEDFNITKSNGRCVYHMLLDSDADKYGEYSFCVSGHLYVLDGLEPRSEYEIQAATRNAAGLSDFFPSVTLTTSRAAPVRAAAAAALLSAVLFLRAAAFW